MKLNLNDEQYCVACRYYERSVVLKVITVILTVVMLNDVILNVIILTVVVLSVMAMQGGGQPFFRRKTYFSLLFSAGLYQR
jgi:hypothetical protein